MGKLNLSGNKKIVSDKFLYIEPNDNFGKDKNSPVPLEDLGIYVDLRVQYKPQRYMTGYTQEGEEIYVRVSLGSNGSKNTFLGSTKIGEDKQQDFLTTKGYGNYTKARLPLEGTNELFGIESIDISYDNFLVPVVNIKFVDIKGAALHGAEELAHNEYGELRDDNNDICRKFLSAFFTIPYPKFELVVKGFYGKPVYYELTCADFRSSFDSKTGNYNAVAKMIGYSFSLISDIQMCSLLASPYSTYHGSQYWKEQIANGNFTIDGYPMPTLQEIVTQWNRKMDSIEEIEKERNDENSQLRMQELQNSIDNLRKAKEQIIPYLITHLVDMVKKNDYEGIEFDSNSNILISFVWGNIYGGNTLDNLEILSVEYINQLKQKLGKEFYNWSNIQVADRYDKKSIQTNQEAVSFLREQMDNKNISSVSQEKILSLFQEAYFNDKNNSQLTIYFVDYSDLLHKISQNIENNYISLSSVQISVEDEINEKLATLLGFKPTLENITKICFAHLETFLYMFECVKKEEKANGLDIILKEGGKEKKYDNAFKIFPEYRIVNNVGGIRRLEESYIAEILPEKSEIKFVKGLLRGIKDGVSNDNNLPYSVTKIDKSFICFSPFDLIRGVNPFSKLNDSELTEEFFINRLTELFVLGCNRFSCIASEMGKKDAQNYHKLYPRGYDGLPDDLINHKWTTQFKNKFYYPPLESNIYDEFITYVNNNWTDMYGKSFVDGEKIENLLCFDKSCKLFDIIDDNSLNGKTLITWSDGAHGMYTINTKRGWTTNENETCFRFKNYINALTAYIVPRVINRDDLDKVPHYCYENDWYDLDYEEIKDVINNYTYNFNENKQYNIIRYKTKNDKLLDAMYEGSEEKLYKFIVSDSDSDSGETEDNEVCFQVIACNSYMNEETHTILTIPGFTYELEGGMIEMRNPQLRSGTLFMQPLYYQRKSVYSRAILFLHTFLWGRDYNIDGGNEPTEIEPSETVSRRENRWDDDYKNLIHFNNLMKLALNMGEQVKVGYDYRFIEVLPKFFVLKMGSLVYCDDNALTSFNGDLDMVSHYLTTRLNDDNDWDILKVLKSSYRKKLKEYFVKWVDETYKKWDEVFLQERNVSDKKSKLYYLSFAGSRQFNADMYTPLRFFRQDNWIVQEMTKQFFELVVLYKYNPIMTDKKEGLLRETIEQIFSSLNSSAVSKYEKKYSPYPCIANYQQMQEYMNGFMESCQTLFADKIENKISKVMKSSSSDEMIEFALYRYLRQIWDRWIVSENNDYGHWKIKDIFDEEKKRIHFIDSSYNKIGHIVPINLSKFCELIQSCKEQDLPFLSFLSYFYENNQCVIYNIQNFYDNQNSDNVEQIFQPIPFNSVEWDKLKHHSDLVVMFAYQPAESTYDSFDITADNQWDLPEHLQALIHGDYRIPAIGVVYGGQNQNYFIDIDVSMKTPNVTDQSIQAYMRIADENSKDAATDSRIKVRSFGQDMWQVVANHAYECTVKMLGCAWIQPLMYFQLLNVPLFKGAYIIQKVNHSIQSGQMVTTFNGVKISKKALKIMKQTEYIAQKNMTQNFYDIREKEIANVENDCPYVFYNPYGDEDKSNERYNVEFKNFMETSLNFEDINVNYYEYFALVFIKTAIDIVEEKSKRELFVQLLIVLLHNFWVRFRQEYKIDKLFEKFLNTYSNILFDGTSNVEKIKEVYKEQYEDIKRRANSIKQCFNNPEKWVEWSNPNDTLKESIHQLDGIVKESQNQNGEYIYLYEIEGWQFIKGMYGKLQSYFGKNFESIHTAPITIENIVDSINKSIKHLDILKGYNLEIYKLYNLDTTHRALLKFNKNDANEKMCSTAFDVILQTYSDFLRSIVWIVKDKNSSSEIWQYIGIELKTNNLFDVKVAYVSNETTLHSTNIDSYDNLNSHFYMSLMKKYSINLSEKVINDNFKRQCVNFISLTSDNEQWKENVFNFLNSNSNTKNIKIENCNSKVNNYIVNDNNFLITDEEKRELGLLYNYRVYPGFQHEGADSYTFPSLEETRNQLYNNTINAIDDVEVLLRRNGFSPMEDVAYYASQNIKKPHDGVYECAKWVRRALEAKLKFKTNDRPNSACRYWQVLEWWGFTRIYYGMTKGYNGDFINGDIIVTEGLDNGQRSKMHGHIQIYYNGKWYADKMYKNANVYEKSGDRPSFIYRALPKSKKGIK